MYFNDWDAFDRCRRNEMAQRGSRDSHLSAKEIHDDYTSINPIRALWLFGQSSLG